jgi:hypothetical protein
MLFTCIDIGESRWESEAVLHCDARTEVICDERLQVDADLCHEISGLDSQFGQSSPRRKACLMHVKARSVDLGDAEAWVLYLPMTNLQFLCGWIGRHRVRIATLVRVRLGLGMGGCGLCLAPAYPWLWWIGCRQMVSDGEAHAGSRDWDRVRKQLFQHDFPHEPPAFDVEQTGPVERWSGYEVRPLRLKSAPGTIGDDAAARHIISSIAMPPWR